MQPISVEVAAKHWIMRTTQFYLIKLSDFSFMVSFTLVWLNMIQEKDPTVEVMSIDMKVQS